MSDFFDGAWKTLKALAPTVATALGGPVAGLAVRALGDALGQELGTPEDALRAVAAATPEQLLAIKNSEQAFVLEMQKLDLDVFKLEVDDRKDSRARAIAMHDFSPNFIGLVILVFWGFTNYTLLTMDAPPKVGDMTVGRILGMIDAATMAFLYWIYGGSKTGDRAIREATGGGK